MSAGRRPASRRRTQSERSAATTSQLVEAARTLFARDGYAATSLEAVARESGVSKGAVYHHFPGKHQLFEAVFKEEQRKLGEVMARAYASKRDQLAGLAAGGEAFMEASLDPARQRIVFLDAPSILGWRRKREIEAEHSLALIQAGLRAAADAGRLRRRDVEPLAHVLYGGLCEGAMLIADSDDDDDQRAVLRRVSREQTEILKGLAAQ
jgi:AcrR family transcriptional regulator